MFWAPADQPGPDLSRGLPDPSKWVILDPFLTQKWVIFGPKNDPIFEPFLRPKITHISIKMGSKMAQKWTQKWLKNGSKMDPFLTHFGTPF
jgi:hypothetical protein